MLVVPVNQKMLVTEYRFLHFDLESFGFKHMKWKLFSYSRVGCACSWRPGRI